ncbi:MAG: sugar ABC transporter permease [Oscillospiraceae bacterium]|jgi:multiple sugar transport system permease protein|nr:sugar ABC transporter permease [Oscillospiraceae bacterium]
MKNKRALIPWLFLAPSLLSVSVMVLAPFGDAVRRSFFSAMSRQFVGFKNYAAVFRNEAFQLAAKNTAKFALVCVPLLLLFSLALAMLLGASKDSRGFYKTSFLVPIAIPVASMVLLWRVVFHENGLLNAALARAGLPPSDWLDTGSAFGVLVFTYLWKNVGYDMVLWISGLSGIDPALYESAQLDGAGWWKRFTRITLPGLAPTLFTVTVLSLLNAFKVFREAYLIAGSYPHGSIYMLQHLFNNWFVSLDVDKMCAGAVLMALVVAGLILLLQWGARRRESGGGKPRTRK